MASERLQKLLARAGVSSRRKAEDLIREGRVTVNGTVAALGARADPEHDSVKFDGKRVHPATSSIYLLFNKPKGCLTTRSDPEGRRTVYDLIPASYHALAPVGRLDYQTEGLLLFTNDGEFAERIAHPRFGCKKSYLVKVKGTPRREDIVRLRRGIVIDGRKTKPAWVEQIYWKRGPADSQSSWWRVEISEGRTRQIREMFFRVDCPVQKLKRVAIGGLEDPALAVGEFRHLEADEVRLLREGQRPKRTPRRRPRRA